MGLSIHKIFVYLSFITQKIIYILRKQFSTELSTTIFDPFIAPLKCLLSRGRLAQMVECALWKFLPQQEVVQTLPALGFFGV